MRYVGLTRYILAWTAVANLVQTISIISQLTPGQYRAVLLCQ